MKEGFAGFAVRAGAALMLCGCSLQAESLAPNARNAIASDAKEGSLPPLQSAAANRAPAGPPDGEIVQEFFASVRQGRLETVRRLAAQDMRLLSACGPSNDVAWGETPLWVAVDAGNLEMVKLLVESGARAKEHSALKRAVVLMDNKGMVSVLKELSFKRVPVSAPAKAKSDTPVDRPIAKSKAIAEQQEAGADHRLAILTWLLEHGADPNAEPARESVPLLIYSIYLTSDDRVLSLLLKHGANPNARDTYGYTALHAAALTGNTATARTLASGHADMEAAGVSGETALMLAAAYGDLDMVRTLLDYGARVAARDKPVARVLLDSGAPVDPLDQNGNTPLSLAVRFSHPAVVELLLVHKANVSHKNNDGLSVLELARSQKSSEIEEMLRRHGAGGGRLLGDESGGPNTDNASAGKALQSVDPVAAAERSLREAENNLAPDHPEVAACLCRLADAYAAQGQNPLAATMYRRALSIREKALGPDHAEVAEVLEKLAAVYRKIGSWEKAVGELEKRAASLRTGKP